jgi:DNA (cytosine-5)-methyltransferase 1
MKLITLFSGIGMQEQGIKKVVPNYELINFCEYDKNIGKCFEIIHKEPSSKNLGDITKLNISEYCEKLSQEGNSDIDVLISSFPCQSFSLAGKKKGFDCPKNGNLFDKSYEMIEQILPKIVIFENVKNITSKKFNAIENITEKMEKIGYTCSYKILNGIDYGIPQNRERWFMVCLLHKKEKFEFPKPIPLQKKMKDFLETEPIERSCVEKLKPYFEDQYKKNYRSNKGLLKLFDGCSQHPNIFTGGFTGSRVYSVDGCSPTFTTSNDCHFWEVKGKLTSRERWRLMGLQDSDFDLLKEHNISDSLIHKICGNGIIVDVFEHLFRNVYQHLNTNDEVRSK